MSPASQPSARPASGLDRQKRRIYSAALGIAGVAAAFGFTLQTEAQVPDWARLVFGPGIMVLCVVVVALLNTRELDMRKVERWGFVLTATFLFFRVLTVFFLRGEHLPITQVVPDFSPWMASVFIFAFVALPNRVALPASLAVYFALVGCAAAYVIAYGIERVTRPELNTLVQEFVVSNAFTITMLFFLARTKAELSRERTARQLLARQASTDDLTGLANRRHVLEALRRAVLRADREGGPVSVLMFDLDHFKAINDAHGHAAGDAVLRRVAELSRATVRESDDVGRYGGEEFLVVAPMADAAAATRLAERMRTAFETDRSDGHPAFTASFGVACHVPGEPLTGVLRRADDALYAAKHRGRNRVVTAEAEGLAVAAPP